MATANVTEERWRDLAGRPHLRIECRGAPAGLLAVPPGFDPVARLTVLLGLMGAVAGVAFGVGFGWAESRAFLQSTGGPVSYPVVTIAGYIALAAVAALLASVVPARRAARLTVIDGLAAD